MEFKEFTAGINDDNKRFDRILRNLLPDQTLTDIFKAIRKGLIKLNGKKSQQETRIHSGDVISVPVFLLEKNENSKKQKENTITAGCEIKMPEILFENQHIIVLNKPYDSLVQSAKKTDISLDKIVADYYRKKSSDTSLTFNPGPLHRLDRKTTGLIAFSLSLEGARWFSENIKNHSIKKTYHALIQGNLTESCHWEDFIQKEENPEKTGFHKVRASSKTQGSAFEKTAVTDISPLSSGTYRNLPVTLCQIKIQTGRMHQIRAQCSLHGFPLLGDSAYGGKKITEPDFQDYIFLHARTLTLPENSLGLPSEITAPYPKAFSNFISQTCEIKFCEV